MRYKLKKTLFICLLSLAIYTQAQETTGKKKPNLILIVADDLGYGDLGITGSKQIKTPNIDQLAKTGVFFSQGYVTSPVCAPSRAGFLTGVNQVKFGFDNNLGKNQPGFNPDFLGLPLDQRTIADYLKDLGYINGIIGKWHLGYEDHFHPLNRGFDEFWGYRGGGHDYFVADPHGEGYLAPIESNYKTTQKITYITDDKGDECVSFIKRHKEEPFFLYASFNAPHAPMQATPEDLKRYKNIKDQKRRTYAAMIHRLDVNIGRIINELANQDIRENTLIILISDNGGPVGVNASLNAPYRGAKGTLLEGGIRIPFLINWPGAISGGKIFKEPITSLDIAPTFIALAGGNIDHFEGKNLIPYLNEDKRILENRQLKWRFTVNAAIREGAWKLIRLPDRLPQLYNLEKDISEKNNVVLEHLDKTQELLKKLGNWDLNLPHPVFLEGPKWRKRQVDKYDWNYQLTQPEVNKP
ncbi:sulfatase-like hydrolase/transferase [Salegentibacter maritimus]|uniref:Sulfatase-like hydrolase/transferase n=1 Tax=Salegentibacter maritimus TaxID=2794347 RepID=A0ABS0TLB3_9FLAO|nr:sulfatase-like hydrolase/transferase [Salegentibacter maritimus]MBI6120819.1 sulfatase-like hydrolase/transferase [Salegentibacter maritimus]